MQRQYPPLVPDGFSMFLPIPHGRPDRRLCPIEEGKLETQSSFSFYPDMSAVLVQECQG